MLQKGQEEKPALLTHAENTILSKEIEQSSSFFFHTSFYSIKETFSSINMKTEKENNDVLAKLDKFSFVFFACGFLALALFLALNVYLGISANFDENGRLLPTIAGFAIGISAGLEIGKSYLKGLVVQ